MVIRRASRRVAKLWWWYNSLSGDENTGLRDGVVPVGPGSSYGVAPPQRMGSHPLSTREEGRDPTSPIRHEEWEPVRRVTVRPCSNRSTVQITPAPTADC